MPCNFALLDFFNLCSSETWKSLTGWRRLPSLVSTRVTRSGSVCHERTQIPKLFLKTSTENPVVTWQVWCFMVWVGLWLRFWVLPVFDSSFDGRDSFRVFLDVLELAALVSRQTAEVQRTLEEDRLGMLKSQALFLLKQWACRWDQIYSILYN